MILARTLADPPIARLWGALALAATGDELFRVALVWLAVLLVAEAASYLSALTGLVLMLGSALGGRLIDGRDPRGVMLAANLARAAIALLPVAAWLAGGPMLAALALAAAGLASLRAQFDPAVQACLPRLTRDEASLIAANGLVDSTQRLARVIGPGLAGPLAWLIPIEHFFTVIALVLLASAALLAGLPRLPPPPPAPGARRGGVRDAAKLIARHRVLATMTAINTWIWGAWVVAIPLGLALVVAQRRPTWLGIDAVGAYAFLIAVYGAANLAANIWIAQRGRRPGFALAYAGETILGLAIGAMGAIAMTVSDAWLLPALAAAAFVGALGAPAHDIRFAFEVQTAPPRALIAPVFRVRMTAAWGAVFVAGLVGPTLVRWWGIGPTILLMGLSMAAASALGWGILRGR